MVSLVSNLQALRAPWLYVLLLSVFTSQAEQVSVHISLLFCIFYSYFRKNKWFYFYVLSLGNSFF